MKQFASVLSTDIALPLSCCKNIIGSSSNSGLPSRLSASKIVQSIQFEALSVSDQVNNHYVSDSQIGMLTLLNATIIGSVIATSNPVGSINIAFKDSYSSYKLVWLQTRVNFGSVNNLYKENSYINFIDPYKTNEIIGLIISALNIEVVVMIRLQVVVNAQINIYKILLKVDVRNKT